MNKCIILSLALASALACGAQGAADGRLAPRARLAAKAVEARKACPDSLVSVYVSYDQAFSADLSDRCERFTPLAPGKATARVKLSGLSALASAPGVTYVQTGATARQMLDIARPETGIDKVHEGASGLGSPYTGKGVVVGIVDAGFDYTHIAFRDADNRIRIKRVWEQGAISSKYPSPEKYGYGVELSLPGEIAQAQGDISGNSHGTHVAAIAAGSATVCSGAYLGMAPEAEIVLVSLGHTHSEDVEISNAISYIYDYATERGLPCVVNLSLGMHAGPHDGTSTFDTLADALQGPGRLIVGSAGNFRSQIFHAGRAFGSADDAPLRTLVDFRSSVSKGGTIEVWGEPDADFEVVLIDNLKDSGDDSERQIVYPATEPTSSISVSRNITGTVEVASEISPLNGKKHVVLTTALRSVRSGHQLAIEITPKGAGRVDMWADNVYLGLKNSDLGGFEKLGSESTIGEIGGTGKRILSVGAYTTRPSFIELGKTEPTTVHETLGQIASFSSNGPTADGRIKPDVAAPGCMIASAVSINDNSGTLLYAGQHNDGTRYHLFGYMQGTSMSSPAVAGVVATWLQAYPELTPEQLHEIVASTAVVPEGAALPDNNWGYGKIDALAGLKKCIELSAVESVGSDPDAPFGAVVRAVPGEVRADMLADAPASIRVHSLTGALVASVADPSATVGSSLSLSTASLSPGVYLATVSVGRDSRTIKIMR